MEKVLVGRYDHLRQTITHVPCLLKQGAKFVKKLLKSLSVYWHLWLFIIYMLTLSVTARIVYMYLHYPVKAADFVVYYLVLSIAIKSLIWVCDRSWQWFSTGYSPDWLTASTYFKTIWLMAVESRSVTIVPLLGSNYPTWRVQCRMAQIKGWLRRWL